MDAELIPPTSQVYALDPEWKRRYPHLVGILACGRCAVLDHEWACRTLLGRYVPGHLPAANLSVEEDYDSWCHILTHGTHAGMARAYPWSALQQGGGDYLRWLADRPTSNRAHAQALKQLRDLIKQWDRHNNPQNDSPAVANPPAPTIA